MSGDVRPLRPGCMVSADTAAIRDTLATSTAEFEKRYGTPPIGAAWVLTDARGNTLTGWVSGDQPLRQALALAGARLTQEAVEP